MIVDLARNDLGRVAEFGIGRRSRSCARSSRIPGVHHLVSTVEARLRAGVSVADVVRATFPPGSVTGAPKIRALEIIEELEPVRRGPYCGAIGWFGPGGDSSCRSRSARSSPPRERAAPARRRRGHGRLRSGASSGARRCTRRRACCEPPAAPCETAREALALAS